MVKTLKFECGTPCSGNSNETCGGTWRFDLFAHFRSDGSHTSPLTPTKLASKTRSSHSEHSPTPTSDTLSISHTSSAPTVSSSSHSSRTRSRRTTNYAAPIAPTSSHKTTSSKSSSIVAPKPTAAKFAGTFQHLECIIEPFANGFSGRALTDVQTSGTHMSAKVCAETCANYRYMGLEYSSECYCSNSVARGTGKDTQGACDYPCSGNSSEACGGAGRLNLAVNLAQVFSSAGAASPSFTPSLTPALTASHTTSHKLLEAFTHPPTVMPHSLSHKTRSRASPTRTGSASLSIHDPAQTSVPCGINKKPSSLFTLQTHVVEGSLLFGNLYLAKSAYSTSHPRSGP